MSSSRILIAGIGNIFMGDDAFGCEVAARLAQRSLPSGVRVVDFGIRSLDLTYAMLEELDAVILVDAMPRGGVPGTLYVLEPRAEAGGYASLDGHSMDPAKVLEAVAALGGRVDRVLVVGCEPVPRDAEADWEQSLSEPVRAALEDAVALVESLVRDIVDGTWPPGRVITGGIDHESASAGR